ncbi:TonB-dependent receptor [Massilia sp. R2A-15]|uniref:TonB-dependent receptor n=1 Tax=Massilia sp. R2A-15 TaxID=3064278 RepID=UPI002735145A|nr:TonB-dependent receptor [Massilia sp. R2A-15]WLI89938.1 TonB-dependent receptor [Massilia sp. R2A-15]
MSISGAVLMMPFAAGAQAVATPAGAQVKDMGEVIVYGKKIESNPNAENGVAYKARTSGDSRHTRPLAETPQTIAVVTKAAIDDSGMTDLKQVLGAQPGITLGTGENGNAFGDRYIIRGQEARSDVFVDGLRDPGMSTRESFAIEQLEISKGPNSSFAGRGTAGGAINAITKQATLDKDFTRVSAAVGSDSHKRVSTDINKGFGDHFALRANALYGDEGVPDRAPSDRGREGVAVSGLWERDRDLSVTLDYYGLRTKDHMPDLGAYLVGAVPNRVPATNVPVYAQTNDFLKSNVDTVTARINWKLAPSLRLTSLTRYGKSENSYNTTGANSATRFNGATGDQYTTVALDNGHSGWQDIDYFAHQSNLRWDVLAGGLKHEFIVGAEYTDHKVVSGNYAFTNTTPFNCKTTAGVGANNGFCWTDSKGNPATSDLTTFAGRSATRLGQNQDWRVKTIALTAMDTVDLTDKFTAFGGLRVDHFDLDLVRSNNLTNVTTGDYGYKDTLVNGHLGLSYKVTPKGIVYGSVASAQDINGGEADAGTASGYGGAVLYQNQIAGAKPETSINLELGTKWNLFGDKLLATGALFQTTKKDVMEGANYDTVGTFNTGKNRVRGAEFSLTGDITEKLTAQIGASFMKSKVLGSAVAANIGNPLSNFAERTASAQLKYQLTNAFSFGATVRHESDRCGGQPDTGAQFANGVCMQPVPSFTVADVFAAYRFNKKLDLRVNVLNAGNKDYYTAVYRSGAFLYKGDARAVRLTLNYEI